MSLLSIGALCVSALGIANFAHAETDEATTAKNQLNRQMELLQSIEKYTERSDLARLFVLKKADQTVIDSITRLGMGHMQTIRDYQTLIVAFRYSSEFFMRVQTQRNKKAILEIISIGDAIAQARGFDDSPYTQITKSVFGQMKKLIDDMQGLVLPQDLLEKLFALRPAMGEVIAIASQGDRPKAFAAATALHSKLIELYPAFSTLSISNPAFEIILNIQGLNEFYAEFAQLPPTL